MKKCLEVSHSATLSLNGVVATTFQISRSFCVQVSRVPISSWWLLPEVDGGKDFVEAWSRN